MSATALTAPVEEIVKHWDYKPEFVERVGVRREKQPLAIHDPNPEWPARFRALEAKIRAALGDDALIVTHVGSTSVPGLPAKDVIDIDLTVPDIDNEDSYVPALEAQGFHFKNREPRWYKHRFFAVYSENWCNLHVWGPGSPEVVRHVLMRDWLRTHDDDRDMYARVKREAADATNQVSETVMDYNLRKEGWIRDLLQRIFVAHGYIEEGAEPICI